MLQCAYVSVSHVARAATHHCLNMVPLSSQPHLVLCADMKAESVPCLWQGFGQGGLMIEIISTDPGGPRPAPMAQQPALQQPPFQGMPAQRPPIEALGVTLKPSCPDMNVHFINAPYPWARENRMCRQRVLQHVLPTGKPKPPYAFPAAPFE